MVIIKHTRVAVDDVELKLNNLEEFDDSVGLGVGGIRNAESSKIHVVYVN